MAKKAFKFDFKPFSNRQLKVLNFWTKSSPVNDKYIIIADGAIRSGKTVSMALSFVLWAMATFSEQNLGMCGKTVGSFRRNVLGPLKQMLLSEGYTVVDRRSDNLVEISANGVTNYFYVFGGKDEGSQDLIQGITLAGVLFDEVVLMPESFVNQATARCSIKGAKIFFNCNPGSPYHWFYLEYIQKLKQKNALYLHFTMDDNLSLDDEVKERYRNMYSGVFYKRYILGLWCQAEGAIYDMFDETKHVVKHSEIPYSRIVKWWVCCDYGTGNATTFLLQGRTADNKYYQIGEYYYDGHTEQEQQTDLEYAEDMAEFIEKYKKITGVGYKKMEIIIDPSAKSFKVQLKRLGMHTRNANNDVLNGIRYVATQLKGVRLFFHESCINTIKEFSAYIWDKKAQAKGDDAPLKENDHCMDAMRYGVYTNRRKANIANRGKQTGLY